MSESVRYFLESRVPELEDLFMKNLFSKDEIKEIVSKRTKFEHKIRRRGAILEDFLAYILFETELEHTRKQRYEILNIRMKHSLSDHSIIKYILSLYRRAVTKFRGNMDLWYQYINFARESKSDKAMPKILASALQLHPESVDIWINAAEWELNHLKNPASARALFLRSIRINNESKILWREYFRMELKVADSLAEKKLELSEKINEEKEEMSVYDGAIAISVFKFAVKECPLNSREAFQFYALSLEYKNLRAVSRFIETFISEKMTDKFSFYILKANSEAKQINFENENFIIYFENCMCYLNEALKNYPLTAEIISEVIEVLQCIFGKTNYNDHKLIRTMIYEKISHIFESAEKSNLITPEHFITWIQIAEDSNDYLGSENFLQRSLSKYPTNSVLLEKKVVFESCSESINFDTLSSNFAEIIKCSPKNCSGSLDGLFEKFLKIENQNLLDLAFLATKSLVPSSKAIEYILKFSSEVKLIESFDYSRITSEFTAVIIQTLITNNIFSNAAKKFIAQLSIFSSSAFSSNQSALSLIQFSLIIGDIELCDRIYSKSLLSLPASSFEKFSSSFEKMKESTSIFPF